LSAGLDIRSDDVVVVVVFEIVSGLMLGAHDVSESIPLVVHEDLLRH
jgi:hypothetical protein